MQTFKGTQRASPTYRQMPPNESYIASHGTEQAIRHRNTQTRSLIAPTGAKGVFLPQHHGNRRWALQLGSSRRLLTACLPELAEEPGTAALCPPRTHLYPHLLFSIKGRGGRGSCRGLRAGHPPPKRLISLPASGAQVSQLREDEHLPSSRAGVALKPSSAARRPNKNTPRGEATQQRRPQAPGWHRPPAGTDPTRGTAEAAPGAPHGGGRPLGDRWETVGARLTGARDAEPAPPPPLLAAGPPPGDADPYLDRASRLN